MPAPTNTTPATAIDIGTVLPYTTTQNVNFGGTTYTVWYHYMAQPGDVVIGIFAFGDLAAYTVALTVYSPNGTTVYVPPGGFSYGTALNVPMQIVAIPGQSYWFKCASNSGNVGTASLSFSVRKAPSSAVPTGSILICDDTAGLPLAILSSADGTVLRFLNGFAASENADVLNTGQLYFQDGSGAAHKLYDSSFNLLAKDTFNYTAIVSTNKTSQFYVGDPSISAHARVTTVSKAGVLGSTVSVLPSIGLNGMAPNGAETILYYTGQPTQLQGPVKRWDLINQVALSDLAAGINNFFVADVVVLNDDTVLVVYFDGTNARVLRYSTAGATLNTYIFAGVGGTFFVPRICRALDDANSFWMYGKTISSGLNRFVNVKVSDGSTIATFDRIAFEGGIGQAAATATPADFFGASQSCPIVISRAASTGCTSYT